MSYEAVLRHFEHVRRTGDGKAMVRCPAHDDRTPSLSIDHGEGKTLVHCHAGCETKDVLAAAGLTEADLFDDHDAGKRSGYGPVVATYPYDDEDGTLLYEVVRTADKQFPVRVLDPSQPNGYAWGLNGARRVPFHLPKLLAARDKRNIFVVEGEKDALAIERAGGVATCNPFGAGNWRDEYSEYLRGAHVLIVADKDEDEKGYTHAAQVLKSLTGIATSVAVVEAKDGKDAADHLAAGNGLVDFVPVAPEKVSDQLRKGVGQKRFFSAREIAEMTPEVLPWRAKPWAADGALTEVEGKIKAAGKTTFVLAMAAAVLDGAPFMDEPTTQSPVVCLTEQPRTSFREALRRANLLEHDDFSVLFRLDALDLSWSEVVALAEAECLRIGAKLLIVDTLARFAVLGDENAAAEAQAAAEPVQAVAHRHAIAALVVRHSRKGGGEVGESGRGSSAFGGAVDLIVSLRRREGNAPANQRVIYTLGRFDEVPDNLVVELTDSGYVAIGSEEEAGTAAVHDVMIASLAEGASLTEPELKDAVEEEVDKPSRTTLRRGPRGGAQERTDQAHRRGEARLAVPLRAQQLRFRF